MKTCMLCGNTQFSYHDYPQKEISAIIPVEKILVCEKCGFGQASPMPDEANLQKFYENGLYWTNYTLDRGYQIHCLNQSLNRLRLISKDMNLRGRKELKVLDVGAGPGHMLNGLKQKFNGLITYYYKEPDDKCVEAIRLMGSEKVKVIQYEEG